MCCVTFVLVIGILVVQAKSAAIQKCTIPQTRPTNESYTRVCLPASELNRTYAFSQQAPISTALNAQPWGSYGLLQLITHFETEGARVRALARQKRPLFVSYTQEICNVHADETQLRRVNRFLSELGIGLLRTSCVTELATKRAHTPVAALRTFLKELEVAGKERTKWNISYAYQTYQYSDITDHCELMRISAVRQNSRWSIHGGVTNLPPHVYREDGVRVQVAELLELSPTGEIAPVPLVLRNSTTGEWQNATTYTEIRGSVHGTSLFNQRDVAAENPALLAAIAERAHQRQQVISYASPSIMAVIIVPVVSSLIPVAYFTSLSTPVVLGYTVLKDIVNSIPLIIKGTELILFGKGMIPQATRTWVYGGETEEDIAVAETWFAKCRANNRVTLKGIIFIIMAISLTAFGITLELFVIRTQHKAMRRKVAKEMKQRFDECRQLWSGAICTDCPCAEMEIEAVAADQLEKSME